MKKLLLLLVVLATPLWSQQSSYLKYPINAEGSINVQSVYGDQLQLGLRYNPARYVWTYNVDADAATFRRATISMLTAAATAMTITNLVTDDVSAGSLPYVGFSGSSIAANIVPYYQNQHLWLGWRHRPIYQVYARNIEVENLTLGGEDISSVVTSANYDHYPIYPDGVYFNYDVHDSVSYSVCYDPTNWKNYLEAQSGGTALQFADVVIQQEVPSDYDEFDPNFIYLEYCTQQQDTTITYINIKVYEDSTLLYQTHKFCSKWASVWYDTTITAASAGVNLTTGDNLVLRIETGAKEWVGVDQWVRLSRLKMNFKK